MQENAKPKKYDERARLIRLIHVARRDLAMDEDTYRAMLSSLCGKNTTTQMTLAQLREVLAHLKARGFKVRTKKRPPRISRTQDFSPQATKARALWLFLHQMGEVKDPSERALAAFARRTTRVDALQWNSSAQMVQLIEILKKWAMRLLPERVTEMFSELCELLDSGVPMDAAMRDKTMKAVKPALMRPSFNTLMPAWEQLDRALRSVK